MKTTRVYMILALVSLWLHAESFAQRGMQWRGSGGWGAGSQYGKLYDTTTVETIDGEVVSVEKFTPRNGQSSGIHVMLRTEHESVSVHLGPAWFIENQEAAIEPNDQIEVTGSRIDYEGRPAIIAASVKKGDEVLLLRDDEGFPSWIGWRRGVGQGRGWHGKGCCMGKMGNGAGSRYDPKTIETVSGEVLGVEKHPAKRGNFNGVHLTLKANGEELDVHVGPEWFVEDREMAIAAGDKIEVTGSRITDEGKPVLIAKDIVKGDSVLKLRDELGLPAWRGWRRR